MDLIKQTLTNSKWIVGILLLTYSLMLLGLYFGQEKLIFFPQSISKQRIKQIKKYQNGEEINLTTPDGVKLHGWLLDESEQEKSPLIIYFGGNGEEVSEILNHKDKFAGWSVLLINYRGYGLSEGQPSEDKLYQDALYLYDVFTARKDIDEGQVLAWGRSLGTGVATYLAVERNIQGAVLVSPYDSVKKVAQEKLPLIPISLLLRHKFDSESRAAKINVPLLCLAAEEDKVIPRHHSQALFEKWQGAKKMKIIKAEGHNTLMTNPKAWHNINRFLNQF